VERERKRVRRRERLEGDEFRWREGKRKGAGEQGRRVEEKRLSPPQTSTIDPLVSLPVGVA